MRCKWIYISLLFLASVKLNSQNLGARNIALGNTLLTQDDILSASKNIAKLSSINFFTIGIATSNHFSLKEVQHSLITLGIPLLKNTLALELSTYGFILYREIQIGIAYSIKFSPQFSLGLKLNYQNLTLAENLGSSGSFYPDIGSNYRFNDKIELGVLFKNITLTKIHETGRQTWPVVSIVGIKYSINTLVQMHLESAIELDHSISIRYGLEYQVHSILLLRAGINSQPASFTFGFGLILKNFKIDLASSYQSTLGFSPALSIRYDKVQ